MLSIKEMKLKPNVYNSVKFLRNDTPLSYIYSLVKVVVVVILFPTEYKQWRTE